MSVSGMVKYYDNATEYIAILSTRTPFLDYSRTKLNGKLKLMTENRVNGDFNVQLNDDNYALFVKGKHHESSTYKAAISSKNLI